MQGTDDAVGHRLRGLALAVGLLAAAALAGGPGAAGNGLATTTPPAVDCAEGGSGLVYTAESGFQVEDAGNAPPPEDGVFVDNDTLRFPHVLLSGGNRASLRLENGTGDSTCYAAVEAPTPVTIAPNGEADARVQGQFETLSLGAVVLDDGVTDVAYAAAEPVRVTYPELGFDPGTSVTARDAATGRALANATVRENGSLALALPAGEYAVTLGLQPTATPTPTPTATATATPTPSPTPTPTATPTPSSSPTPTATPTPSPTPTPTATPTPTPSPTVSTGAGGAGGDGNAGSGQGDDGTGGGSTGGDGGTAAGANQIEGAGSNPRPLGNVPPETVGGGLVVALSTTVGVLGLRTFGEGGAVQGARDLGTAAVVALKSSGGASAASAGQEPVDNPGEGEAPGLTVTVDPLSARSWCAEPPVRALQEIAEDTVEIEYEPAPVREFDDPAAMRERWAAVDERFPMPVDPSFWDEDPPESTELVNRGFAAAAEQDYGSEYVRQQWVRAVAGGQPISDEGTLLEIAETTAEEVDLDVEQWEADFETVDLPEGSPPEDLPGVSLNLFGVGLSMVGVPELDEVVGKLPTKRVGVPKPDARRIARFVARYRNVTPAEVAAAFDLDGPDEAVGKLREVEDVTEVMEGDSRFWES